MNMKMIKRQQTEEAVTAGKVIHKNYVICHAILLGGASSTISMRN